MSNRQRMGVAYVMPYVRRGELHSFSYFLIVAAALIGWAVATFFIVTEIVSADQHRQQQRTENRR